MGNLREDDCTTDVLCCSADDCVCCSGHSLSTWCHTARWFM